MRALNQRFGMRTTWYVPLGVKHFLTKWGVKKVVEMDWWQEVEHFRTKATTTTTAEAAATTAGGAAGAAGSSSSGSGKPAAAAADVTVSVGASAAAPAAGGQQQQQQPSAALRIAYVPAQHWSARGLMDRNHSLWGGYVVTDDATGQRFYFVGDTGAHGRRLKAGGWAGGG